MLSYVDRMPQWAVPQQHRRFTKLVVGILCGLSLLSWLSFFHPTLPSFHTYQLSLHPISNATLGFERIYALALPGREDRTQPLLDAANATNLTLTVLNAVKDADIDHADYPKGWNVENHRAGELGCLASHVRTWNLIVANNVSSALILESDADWDLRIHDIMQPLGKGIQVLVDWPFTTEEQHVDQQLFPYGDSWDIIWIGHCGSSRDGNVRAYTWNDTSVPPEDRESTFDIGLSSEQHMPGTRTVFQFGRTTCTTGYAISNRGARKLAEYVKESDDNIDLKLSAVCSSRPDMTCLGVWPQIITAAETASNIDHSASEDGDDGSPEAEGEAEAPKVEAGPALQYSARVNAHQILRAGGYVPKKQLLGEWDTAWASNPAKNGTWDMMKINSTSGEPIFDWQEKEEEEEKKKKEQAKSNSRVRRALLQG